MDKLPDGRIEVKAVAANRQDFGCFRFPESKANGRSLSIDEMNEIAARGGPASDEDHGRYQRVGAGVDRRSRPAKQSRPNGTKGRAELVALALPALCELVWVLRAYKIEPRDIAAAIRRLLNGANVVVNRPAAEAGWSLLEAGGDFADGVIAYEGKWLGAETFVSFDKKAVKLMEAHGGFGATAGVTA